jgi:hypothetical protein
MGIAKYFFMKMGVSDLFKILLGIPKYITGNLIIIKYMLKCTGGIDKTNSCFKFSNN